MANATTRASASRATRSSRDLRLLVLLALACVAGITVLRAQETAPAAGEPPADTAGARPAGEEKIDFPDAPDPSAAPPARTEPAGTAPAVSEAPPEEDEAATEEEEEPPPEATPRTPGVVGDTPGRFEPTEKVRADFDVSFPVDI